MNMRKALSNLSNSVSTLQRLSLDSVSDHSGRRRTHNFRPSPQDFFMGGEGRGSVSSLTALHSANLFM